ncbi:MAG: ferritin family protein [Nitrospirae bacterium]|nr:ferritin family protein [Nitrospirota bacterium]
MTIDEVIDKAIVMEEEGYDFYKAAEARTAGALGKRMFASLAEDEVRHKKLLQGLKAKMPADARELDIPLPKDRMKSVFADAKADSVKPTTDDIDALTFAMSKEKDSYNLYHGAAAEATDPKVKAVFDRMAAEEDQHFEILEQTKYYLEQNSNWSLWIEGGPIEGG